MKLDLRAEIEHLHRCLCIAAASTILAPDLGMSFRGSGVVSSYGHQPPLNVHGTLSKSAHTPCSLLRTRFWSTKETGVLVCQIYLGSSDASGCLFVGGWLGVNL